jgi:type IV secretory pathway VirB10-like protein
MPITFQCNCGKALKVGDEHAGKRVKCPACDSVASVPIQSAATATPLTQARPIAPARPVAAKPAPPAVDDDFEVVEDDVPPKKRSSRREDDYDDDRPKKRSARRDDDDDDRPARKSSRRRDNDDEDDRPRKNSKKKKSTSKLRTRPTTNRGLSHGTKRILSLIGGSVAVLLGGGLIYLSLTTDSSSGRGYVRGFIWGVIIILCGLGSVIRAVTGDYSDDDEPNVDIR